MSLFDVIKYPISFPPTNEQLEALPEKLYRKWIHHPDNTWCDTDIESSHDPIWVAMWHRDYPHKTEDIELLRKMILELP